MNYHAAHPATGLSSGSPLPGVPSNAAISFTANGSASLIVAPGAVLNYVWTSDGVTATSSYVIDSPDACGNASIGPYPWIVSTPNGSASATVRQCQVGHSYAIIFMARNATGVETSKTILISVVGTPSAVPPVGGGPSRVTFPATVRVVVPALNVRPGPNTSGNPISLNIRSNSGASTMLAQSKSVVRPVSLALNAHSLPDTLALIAGSQVLHAGAVFTAVDEVVGESVSGNNLWWKSSTGDYLWSGGTEVIGQSAIGGSPGGLAASIAAVQGYDNVANIYTNNTATENTYLVLYGVFAATDNTIAIDGTVLPTGAIPYQSVNQINVSLAGIPVGSNHTIVVTSDIGSAVATFAVAAVSAVGSNVSIAHVQGYDNVANTYTNDTAVENTYLVLYGTFAATGNTITIDRVAISADAIPYQSTNQINVSLVGISVGGNHTVVVSNGAGSASTTFAVTATSTTGTGVSPTVSGSTVIGPYFWGGDLSGAAGTAVMAAAKNLAKDLGTGVIRIAMSAKSDMDYAGGACIPNFTLAGLADRPDFKAILSDPQFKTVIITAYDGVSLHDCVTKSYLDPAFYTPANAEKIKQEYTDFANYLKQFSGKTFIIGNWESDNDADCGSTYNVTGGSLSCPTISNSLAGLAAWFSLRHAGIHAAGASNVFDDIEFNSVNALHDKGLPSVLRDVIPQESSDYISYSSYESINVSPDQLAQDIDTIRGIAPGKPLIIGEFGYKVGDFGNAAATAARLQQVVNVIQNKNIPYGIVWNLLDFPTGFGIYDTSGNITTSGGTVRRNTTKLPSSN